MKTFFGGKNGNVSGGPGRSDVARIKPLRRSVGPGDEHGYCKKVHGLIYHCTKKVFEELFRLLANTNFRGNIFCDRRSVRRIAVLFLICDDNYICIINSVQQTSQRQRQNFIVKIDSDGRFPTFCLQAKCVTST